MYRRHLLVASDRCPLAIDDVDLQSRLRRLSREISLRRPVEQRPRRGCLRLRAVRIPFSFVLRQNLDRESSRYLPVRHGLKPAVSLGLLRRPLSTRLVFGHEIAVCLHSGLLVEAHSALLCGLRRRRSRCRCRGRRRTVDPVGGRGASRHDQETGGGDQGDAGAHAPSRSSIHSHHPRVCQQGHDDVTPKRHVSSESKRPVDNLRSAGRTALLTATQGVDAKAPRNLGKPLT